MGGLGLDVWKRLETQVLAPLREGRAARYQVYDWEVGEFDTWVDLPHHAALVVEGVGSAARPVDLSAVLRVWVEVPAGQRLARGVARAGQTMRDEWLHWADLETAHFASDGTQDRAEVHVDGQSRY